MDKFVLHEKKKIIIFEKVQSNMRVNENAKTSIGVVERIIR